MAEYLKSPPDDGAGAQQEIVRTVSEMLLRIERGGITAIREYSRRLDNWAPRSFLVSEDEARRAVDATDPVLRGHIDFARDQIRGFAQHQRATLTDLEVKTLPGVILGHRHIPVNRVGSYSPGGRYPMIASSLMTVVVPKVAGVGTVVAAAPPRDSTGIHPPQLYAMTTAGADAIVALGGVQAMAALAYGIEDLPPADMIVGAGNAYVAEAKRQLFGRVGIDLLAGPTEIAVIADQSADPELVAADLLGQAEHGPTSPGVLITTSRSLAEAVMTAVDRWLLTWPTADVAGAAWRDFGAVILCDGDEEVVRIADELAPEHLEVQTTTPDWYLARLTNYGSLFLGEEATVVYGDKAIGTNHVLPTSRAARYTGGLWVGKFLKTVTYQRVTAEGSQVVAPAAAAISEAEHFGGHAITARLRLDREPKLRD
jgi:sulfopropanediol 3-dehydrogenase